MDQNFPNITFVERPPRKRADGPSPASGRSPVIILLHGRGADENDLIGLAPYLDERLRIFSPRAPYPFEFGGYTYFDLSDDGVADPEMFAESYNRVMAFVDSVASNKNVDAGKIFLMGFSMGTIMAYALALTRPEKFAGVVAQSGFIRKHPTLEFQWEKLQGCPFIITHGTADPVIPVSLARDAKEQFARSGADFIYKEYPMGHEIGEESLADVCRWLTKRLE